MIKGIYAVKEKAGEEKWFFGGLESIRRGEEAGQEDEKVEGI